MEFESTDIIGKSFGKLTVESFSRKVRNEKYKHNKYYYMCKCDCGNTKEIQRVNLITNHTTSCGCLKKRQGKQNPCWGGHGEISSKFWTHIKNHAEHRGIKVVVTIEEAWERFLQQDRKCALSGLPLIMVSVSTQEHYPQKRTASLDRINSSQNYTPSNIQWVHKDLNKMKTNMKEEYFVELCNLVSQFRRKAP